MVLRIAIDRESIILEKRRRSERNKSMPNRRAILAFCILAVRWTTAFLAPSSYRSIVPSCIIRQDCDRPNSSKNRFFAANHSDDDDDDDLEVLSKTLSSLLSSQKTQTELLTNRLGQDVFAVNKTHVRESTIPDIGMGLFASRDCPKGALLTCYPGDALVDLDNDDKTTWGSLGEFTLHQEYMLRAIQDNWGIVAMDGSDTPDDSTYLGHYANDGAKRPLCEQELGTYVIESANQANAEHRPLQDCHMVTVATKAIQKGDEIFVTYGPDYWREQDEFVEDDDETEEFEFGDDDDEDDFDDWEFDSSNDFYDEEAEGIVSDILSSIDDDEQESQTRGKGFG